MGPEEMYGKKKNNIVRNILLVFGVIAFWACVYGMSRLVFKKSPIETVNDVIAERMLATMVAQMNLDCPMMADQETQVDNVEALPQKVMRYNYTLVHVKKDAIDTAEVKKTIVPKIINNTRTSPALAIVRNYNIIIEHYYKDQDGAYIMSVIVTPDLYK